MLASPAVPMALAVIAVCSVVETAAAKAGRSRHPAASHSLSSQGQAGQRKKPPVAPAPTRVDNGWMERASAPSNGGGGGGM